MVKPSLEFFALTFAIFKAGAVPVLVDPGLCARNVGKCLEQAEPAPSSIPLAHGARMVLGWGRRRSRPWSACTRWGWGGHDLEELRTLGDAQLACGWTMARTRRRHRRHPVHQRRTGRPRGPSTPGTFTAQVECIRRTYDIQPGEVDLPTFPLFALFDPALGMTTIVPDMDASKPREADPRKLIEAIEDFGVTNMFGSPALLGVCPATASGRASSSRASSG